VCGARAARLKLRTQGTDILECPACGLCWWEPPASHDPASVYDGAYFADPSSAHGYDDYAGLAEALRVNFRRRLRRLPPPRSGARLLDVGAAYGFSLGEAERLGWRPFAVEIAPEAARRAMQEAPGRVTLGEAQALPFSDGSFDAVTLWDVLEHLPAPRRAMAELARVLQPGGRLALSTGDAGSLAAKLSGARWHLYTLPEHLFFFGRRSLRLLLEGAGFRVLRMRAEIDVYTLGYLAERVRKTLLGRSASRPPRWPGAQLRVPFSLFDVVTVHAVRGARAS
jgi:SAM-dependent methyltransferase